MERRYNRYIKDIFKWIKDIFKWFKDIFKFLKNIPILDNVMKFNIFYELQNSYKTKNMISHSLLISMERRFNIYSNIWR